MVGSEPSLAHRPGVTWWYRRSPGDRDAVLGPLGDIERQLSLVTSVGGTMTLTLMVIQISSGAFVPTGWQQVGNAALAAMILLNLFGSRWLPLRVLTTMWVCFPVIVGLLGLLWLAPIGTPFSEVHRPWTWGMDAAASCYIAMLVRRPFTLVACAILISITPLLSAVVFAVPFDEMPKTFAGGLPMVTIFIGFAFFLVVLRARHQVFMRSRDELHRTEIDRAAKLGELERRREFSLLVHDNVLSVFSAAMLNPDAESDELRAGARSASSMLGSPRDGYSGKTLEGKANTSNLCAAWKASWLGIDPHCRVDTQDLGGEVPEGIAAAIHAAACEALRNSVRHAGTEASRAIDVRLADQEIEVTVSDDGPGFEIVEIGRERLGVRRGIVERVEHVGGTVTVSSAAGSGTRTRIVWLNHC